jgi:hypothetical protein
MSSLNFEAHSRLLVEHGREIAALRAEIARLKQAMKAQKQATVELSGGRVVRKARRN